MERDWMSANRLSNEFEDGLKYFFTIAEDEAHRRNSTEIYCPCQDCRNLALLDLKEVRNHLQERGFDLGYTRWIWHGEREVTTNSCDVGGPLHDDEHTVDRMDDMIRDVADKPEILSRLLSDNEKPLYPGCTKDTRLSAVLRLYNLKAGHGWTDVSFTELLSIVKDLLPEENELPDRTYRAKKILCPMGMGYKKIHACPNDCMLYINEYKEDEYCDKCKVSRYKLKQNSGGDKGGSVQGKGPPAKVLWYLPIIPRFKRLFAKPDDAKNLTWHADRHIPDNKLRHPADSPQWKKIDSTFPDFGKEARNLKIALCTDSVNPYGSLSSTHSSWPVMLTIYNLPPELCMKRKYIMLALMISGPRQPGNDIDVYLRPLIDDLKKLWSGVQVFDAYRQNYFQLRAMIFCTVSDFPAYGNLSGYSVKGHKACPICEENTSSTQLAYGNKTVYLDHRRFLKRHHPFRRLRKAFNGKPEIREAPVPLSGREVYEKVKDIINDFGKPVEPSRGSDKNKNCWKKCSIFFELPYWETLDVRHCLDVMHIEKNIFDSLIGTLLNIPGKTKDGYKARMDLVDMGIRAELAPENRGTRTYLPPACYTLSRDEKRSMCECLRGIKVPQGYSSNISSLVSMKDLKLVGLKSHDCHILMQHLLPVAIRSILPKHVRYAITKLCFFFNAICSKVIDPDKLDEIEEEVIVTVCQLEMYFPPSFFDIMVHLVVHIVREVRYCGPVYLRWMYPFERYMKVLKGYVKTRHKPNASMVQGYIAEEVVDFCSEYLSNVQSVGLPRSRHDNRVEGKGTRGASGFRPSSDDLRKAHLYILRNLDEVQPYVQEHLASIRGKHRAWSDVAVLKEHKETFIEWFIAEINRRKPDSSTLRWLAYKPTSMVTSYSGYDINGYSFYTKSQDDRSTMQNSGVTVVAEALHVSSSKDKNPVYANMSYYGVIEDIWEIDFVMFTVSMFKCKWVDTNNGVRVDELGFNLVDLSKEGFKEEPFILATQAKQVFYITDPCDKKWSVVIQGKRQAIPDSDDIIDDETIPFSLGPQERPIDDDNNVENLLVRNDHDEGIWVEDPEGIKRKRISR